MATNEGGVAVAGQHAGAGRTYVVHIGTLTLKFDESPVLAGVILTRAGFEPATDYTLERLKGAQGRVEQEYQAGDPVTLDDAHEQHFRAVPKGGGRA